MFACSALMLVGSMAGAVGIAPWKPIADVKLTPTTISSFGEAVAIDNQTLVVSGQGAIEVYRWEKGEWSAEALFPGTSPEALDLLGPQIITGAPGTEQKGMVQTYHRYNSGWMLDQRIQPDTLQPNSAFGASASLGQDVLAVGSPGDSTVATAAGAAYILSQNATGAWVEQQKLTPSNVTPQARFGHVVKLSEDLLVIGSPSDDSIGRLSGSAFVYERIDGHWVETAKLTAPTGRPSDRFGTSVATDGNVIFVSAPFRDDLGARQGVVYAFTRHEGEWNHAGTLPNPFPTDNDQFGRSMALRGGILAIGAPGADVLGDNTGAVYVYTGVGTVWSLQTRLVPSPVNGFGTLGVSVATDGRTIVAGSPASNSAYVYTGIATQLQRDLDRLTTWH